MYPNLKLTTAPFPTCEFARLELSGLSFCDHDKEPSDREWNPAFMHPVHISPREAIEVHHILCLQQSKLRRMDNSHLSFGTIPSEN